MEFNTYIVKVSRLQVIINNYNHDKSLKRNQIINFLNDTSLNSRYMHSLNSRYMNSLNSKHMYIKGSKYPKNPNHATAATG